MEKQERICRVCLKSNTEERFVSIFSNNNEIASNLCQIGGISIDQCVMSLESTMICQQCLKELYQCVSFRKKCQNAEEYFKTQLIKTEELQLREDDEIHEDISEFIEPPSILEDNISIDQAFEYDYIEESQQETLDISIRPHNRNNRRTKIHFNKRKTNTLQCRFCGIILCRKDRRIHHERLHFIEQNQEYYECYLCGKRFNQKFGIIPHFKKFHNFKAGPVEKWKCAICENKILQPASMQKHYERQHKNLWPVKSIPLIKNIMCQSTNTEMHQLPNKKPKKYEKKKEKKTANFFPCSICGNNFTVYQRYLKHLKEIHQVDKNEVLEDSITLNHNTSLENKDLIEEFTDKTQTKFPCTTCGKVFASIMTVRAHEKTHLNVQYICDLCGASFRVKAYLTAHVQKIHLKLKKYKCYIESCSASYVHREQLNYHVKRHLNIRNYCCRYCGKSFTTKSCCLVHERIHTDERPYACRYCDRSFIHHSDHRRHEGKHKNLIVKCQENPQMYVNFDTH